MKKIMSLLCFLLISQICMLECLGQNEVSTSPNSQCITVEDVDAVLKKGKSLFDSAHYEEAAREFLIVAQSGDAPQEDRIKAHYFLMRIYRAYGEGERVRTEITEILKLNPDYVPSTREPASVKKLFKEVREEFLKNQRAKEVNEKSIFPSAVIEDMATLERSLAEASSCQESVSFKVSKMEKEMRQLKSSFYITSLTLFLLLVTGLGFK